MTQVAATTIRIASSPLPALSATLPARSAGRAGLALSPPALTAVGVVVGAPVMAMLALPLPEHERRSLNVLIKP
ncbi:MAG TPA: hypothetical protein VJS86_07665 [Arthrobacter sp.]|nr:hypothetical protein [Arthrobacter sp.]